MLTLGNKIIAGSFKTGASWEVGDVGISAFGIDEALNKRRYLNGQVISQAQFVEFTAMLKSRVSVYPSLSTTEVNWQAEVTNSKLGQCGKFVVDDVAGTIRLPKVVNINGLQNLTGLGGIKAESLPNIKGTFGGDVAVGFAGTSGAFTSAARSSNSSIVSTPNTVNAWGFNASLSSSTYQDDAPVQQEAVQYPYFIQVATGVETSIDVSREIELNNPFSLLDYKYSEYELSNASWLLSNGQFNSGVTYQAVYDLLLQIYNGTTTKAGVSVKLSTETYADTDFVLNTTDTTFRLPTVVKLASGKAVVGNGMVLGLKNATQNLGLNMISGGALTGYVGDYGKNIGTHSGSVSNAVGTYGITTDETKSGIETSANGLYLYFYVGETVQDANIIAAAGVLTDVANLKNGVGYSSLGKETVVGWGMPDYDSYISHDIGTYTADFDCVLLGNLVRNSSSGNATITITFENGFTLKFSSANYAYIPIYVPINKGRIYTITKNSNVSSYELYLAPLKGSN